VNSNLLRSIAALALTCVIAASAHGASDKPPFSYSYVTVSYDCGRKHVVVMSQVFGVCYQETNHASVARDQRYTYDRVASAVCGGNAGSGSQLTSYPYDGPVGESSANRDRNKDVSEYVRGGYDVNYAYLQTPYSSKCR
jgi:hypothetical protein